MGDSSAPILIQEFADFQCPGCRIIAAPLKRIQARWPHHVALQYRHFPLQRIHPHAMLAAAATPCAGQQGRFVALHDALYSEQDSIGIRPWRIWAERVAIPDTSAWRECLGAPETQATIEEDMRVAMQLRMAGTPSFIVGDSLYFGVSEEDLMRIVRNVAKRRGIVLPQ